MFQLIKVNTAGEYLEAAKLFEEYAASLEIDLGFQHFEEELLALQAVYGYPSGAIILCRLDEQFIGCIAFKKLDAITAELKRMFVQPAFQQNGAGSLLLKSALKQAKAAGYQYIRLDTLAGMSPAIALYKRNGFYEIPPYYFNPEETAVFFEKKL